MTFNESSSQTIEGMKIFFFRTDPKKLEENGITHIVSILSSMQYKKSDKSEKVKTIKVITNPLKPVLDYVNHT